MTTKALEIHGITSLGLPMGIFVGEEDGRRPPDPQGDAFGCLAVVVLVVSGFLWALTESVSFAVVCGLIGLVIVWKICYRERK